MAAISMLPHVRARPDGRRRRRGASLQMVFGGWCAGSRACSPGTMYRAPTTANAANREIGAPRKAKAAALTDAALRLNLGKGARRDPSLTMFAPFLRPFLRQGRQGERDDNPDRIVNSRWRGRWWAD